jgi:hypothetical protein
MQIKKDFFKALILIARLSVIYYLFYALNANTLTQYCKKYICFEILSYAEFLSCSIALISLYFVLKSLESWKDSYKFERAIEALSKFEELKMIGDRYLLILYELDTKLQKINYDDLIGSFYLEENLYRYKEKLEALNYYENIVNLEHWLNRDKNMAYYKDFKALFNAFQAILSCTRMSISEADLIESNYGFAANESDIKRRLKSIKKVELALEKYKIDKKSFEVNLQALLNKINGQ